MSTSTALGGVRVLDLTDVSGAYCGKLLADMGADVILVEPPGGAAMRTLGPFWKGQPHPNRSLFFWHYSTNKRSITLDLGSAADRECLRRLAASADVVLETFRPGYLADHGLDYATLAGINAELVLVSITPFGQSGPYRAYRGSDFICQAAGGMVYVNGDPAQAPLQGAGMQAYHSAAVYAAVGTLLALLARARCGRGQHVDVSIQECVVACLEHASSLLRNDGRIAQRSGSRHWSGDFRAGPTIDGHVLHGTLGDWTTLLEWVKADDCAADLADPAWQDIAHRRAHCDHLFDRLDAWASKYRVDDLVAAAQLRRLPYAALRSVCELARDPQLQARHFFVPVPHDELRTTVAYPGAPYRFSRSPWRIARRPPLLGEHTAQVIAEIESRSAPAESPPASAGAGSKIRSPLEGIRVIDFTWVVAGPLATRILADHGAEVIKIERRGPAVAGERRGGLDADLNRGKQSLAIDLDRPEGRDLVRQLIATADVVVDNFSPRVMANWGFEYTQLRRLCSDLIVLSMPGFGASGPWRDHVAYGPTLQASTGYSRLMGYRAGAPVGWGFSYSDIAAGCSAALAVLLALWHRQQTGAGQFIDLAQYENLVSLLGPRLLALLNPNGVTVEALAAAAAPTDNHSQEQPSAPHGVFRCANLVADQQPPDRWCAIAVFGDDDWMRFCRALGNPGWARDRHFASALGRSTHATELAGHVESWTQQHSPETVMTILQSAGVAASVVANATDLCDDPHLRERRYWHRVAGDDNDELVVDGMPMRLSATPAISKGSAPRLGEHTDSLLKRLLGLSQQDVAALRAAGVVG
jgi:crotonobetainyl-CoA:carnitine CoA-transferase CaiB-like acyl-CoA transferase